MAQISTASQEQASGVQEINKALNQLDQVTQQNVSAASKSALVSKSLLEQVGSLDSNIETLILVTRGASF